MTKWQKIIFLLILILAFILRFYKLGEIPAGFHADEAAFGYNAYSIYLTGRDEYSAPLPLFLRSFDLWNPALYAYLTIPPIALFGLTEFAVRLPSAVFGFLIIPLVFLLTRQLTKKNSIAILTSFILAILPAQVNLSRIQSDPLAAIFLRRLFILVLSFLFLYNLGFYLHQYYVHQLKHRPWYRHYGYKELVSYIDSVKNNYRQIYITKAYGSPYIFFLFYQKYDPKAYWAQGSPRDKDWGGFDNYVFIPHDCPLRMEYKNNIKRVVGEKGILYVNMGQCELPKTNVKLLKKIPREDGTPAFQILEYVE